MAYDSNNNPKHRFVVDGFWTPFRAIGLIKFEATILAFLATMDYRSGNWKLNQLGFEILRELVEKSSLFKDAYQKLTGGCFDEAKMKKTNLQFVDFIKTSPHFQQALNRVCGRWV